MGLRRIYVTEETYRMLARYCLERYGTLRGITRVASELLAEAISQKSTSPEAQKPIGSVDQETVRPLDQKASSPAVERKELRVEVPPPRIELLGKPLPPVVEAEEQSTELQKERKAGIEKRQTAKEGGAAREPTPRQLALIESLLRQLGDDWGTVREVLLLDKGVEAPEDYRQLSGETLDRVIKTLKEWAKHPAAGEVKDARLRAQKLFEQGVNVGLPESTRDVLRYHLVKLELAEAGALKPRK